MDLMAARKPARRDEDATRRFVDQMSEQLAGWGFPRMAARVLLTITVAEDGTRTAAELAGSLQASPAAISGAVRLLVQMAMVQREPVAGSRRVRYRIRDEAWYEASLEKRAFLEVVADLVAEGTKAVGGEGTEAGARLAEVREFMLFSADELEVLLEKWRESR
jgi:DNA-binding transcriptional regulator GbsR (MarR family)